MKYLRYNDISLLQMRNNFSHKRRLILWIIIYDYFNNTVTVLYISIIAILLLISKRIRQGIMKCMFGQ